MKRKVFAIFCACLMTFSLVACGKTTSADSSSDDTTQVAVIEKPTPEVVVEPEETTKPTVEETKPQEEEPVVQEPAEDTTQEDTTTTDETKPTDTDQGNGNNTDTSTSTDADNTQQDTTTTDQQQTTQDQQPTQTDPTVDTGTSTSTPTVSGTFDVDDFVYNVSNASDYYMTDKQIMLVYGSWFIEISTSASTYSPGNAYISIGRWDYNATYWNINTYSCVFSFGDGSKIASEFYPDYTKYSVSKTALAILPTLVDYMKNSGDPSVAPNIPGYTFKPCQSDNPYVQY